LSRNPPGTSTDDIIYLAIVVLFFALSIRPDPYGEAVGRTAKASAWSPTSAVAAQRARAFNGASSAALAREQTRD
jgi:hypothetical protein